MMRGSVLTWDCGLLAGHALHVTSDGFSRLYIELRVICLLVAQSLFPYKELSKVFKAVGASNTQISHAGPKRL